MKAADEVQNWSNMSAAGPVRRAPVGFDPAEPSDNAEFDLNDTPPTFQFRVDSRIPSYTIALSNSGAFSTRRYVAADGTRCVSLRYRIKPNRTSWTPTVQQWRAIKTKCGTGSAVYWRLEGKQDIEGMVYGPIRRFFFVFGDISNMSVTQVKPSGSGDALSPAVEQPPVFQWTCQGPLFSTFHIDVSTNRYFIKGPGKNDKVLTFGGGKGIGHSPYVLTPAEWRALRRAAVPAIDAEVGHAALYWRVRGKVLDRLTECAGPVQSVFIDCGQWTVSALDLAAVSPTVQWSNTDDGFTSYGLQFSVAPTFDKTSGMTVDVPAAGTKKTSYTLAAAEVLRLRKMAQKFAVTRLYYRVCARDAQKVFVVYSPASSANAP
jgi:hypothetical protein